MMKKSIHGSEKKKNFSTCVSEKKKKILGFCLGSQLLANALGATVFRNQEKEIGWFPIQKHANGNHELLDLFADKSLVFHWHGDTFELPKGAIPLFSSEATKLQGFIMNNKWTGLQFHLETLPQSVEALLKFAKNDLIPGGTFIQSPETMLQGTGCFYEMQIQLTLLLSYLEQK
ncbi:MAG: hypothetical protein JXR65_03285 [Bacteroidales bacterium]|nr:hypothetical protein [Bacteroidales bacterium]